ncbi:MAG: histidine kinase [Gammaproteobacteria bacterium]|nr:histidine kinase [Gammaproteobacteria bacterium]
MIEPHIDLNRRLPFDNKWRWGYQHYPVFSWKWWFGRTLVFNLGVITLTLLSGSGMLVEFTDKTVALVTTAQFLVGLLAMTLIGATSATIARTKIAPGLTQQIAVSSALVFGVVAAGLADGWSSMRIEEAFLNHSSSQKEAIKATLDTKNNSTSILLLDAAVGTLIYFWLAGGIAFIRYWREPSLMARHLSDIEMSQLKASRSDIQARLTMLQAQIEPHFLFNSLASIKSMVRQNPELAEKSIANLVDYLRASVPRLDKSQSAKPNTLMEQIDLCEKYLKVMELRMGDRLVFDCAISPNIESLEFPPLILLSLVENAIKHGIEPKPEGGRVSITAETRSNDIVIKVIDTGIGLNQKSVTHCAGVGLANINDQLQVLYQGQAKLHLEQNQTGGVTAMITIKDGNNVND